MSAVDLSHVALLTPQGRGAVATLVADGPLAVAGVQQHFLPAARGKRSGDYPRGRIVFGRWGGPTGEEVVLCRTADERVEISCHGGRIAAERIQNDLTAAGCQIVSWQQWVRGQGESETQTEACLALPQALTERTAGILLDQMRGALDRELEEITRLRSVDRSHAAVRAKELLEFAPLGLHLTAPWRVVLAGRPNVGKSSLINALLGYERAIVFDEPGTTRDVVTATTALDGWPVELADTAGLRATSEVLEAAGVALAREQISAADVLVLVFDASQPWTQQDDLLTREWAKALIVLNKCDLSPTPLSMAPADALCVSALTGQGIDQLAAELSRRLVPRPPPPGAAVPFTARQAEIVRGLIQQAAVDAPLALDVGDTAKLR